MSKSNIDLAWEPPETDGGLPIKGYHIERKQSKTSRWIKLNKDLIPEQFFAVTDVMENEEYEFRITAVNDEGHGPPSAVLGPVKAKDPFGKLHG